jgi:transposase
MSTQINKLDFTGQNIYAGFDVHKKSWSVTIMTDHLTHKTFSQDPKPDILHHYLVKNFPGGNYFSAYEAGFCGYWIHNRLKELGVNSIVVNPADVPTTGYERDQKNDPVDSKKIARALRNGELKAIYAPPLKILGDRTLLRTRAILVKDITRYKNRIKSFINFHGIEIPDSFLKNKTHWSKRFMSWLDTIEMKENSGEESLQAIVKAVKELRTILLDVTRKIKALSKTEEYQKNVGLLISIPGIGLITAMILLTELGSIERFSNTDQLCKFVGFIPSMHDSGEKNRHGDLTKRGHSTLRRTIIESTWTAARLDPALMRCYIEYCKRMEPNEAIIRIAKKLLSRISYVLKNQKPYVHAVVK